MMLYSEVYFQNKFANITPVHKKDEATDKETYMPVNVLSLFSKSFERVIYDQLS